MQDSPCPVLTAVQSGNRTRILGRSLTAFTRRGYDPAHVFVLQGMKMLKWLDGIPLFVLVIGAVLLGGAPFVPESHLWQKLKMLADGTLSRPIDVFDLILHASIPLLLILKLVRFAMRDRGD
jgi:hypothetical protein